MTTYVIGHKNPDTDSIAAAIAYAALKSGQGEDVRAGRLGPLNEETKFALHYFGMEEPAYLYDARCRLCEIELDPVVELKEDSSCNHAYHKIIKTNERTLYVTRDHLLRGVLSLTDLASIRIMSKEERAALLSRSGIGLICHDVKGEIIVDAPDGLLFNGFVSVYDSDHAPDAYRQRLLVLNNELMLIKCIREAPALVIYSGDAIDDVIVSAYREHGIPLIRTGMPLEEVLRIISEAIPVSLVMVDRVTPCHAEEYIDEVGARIANTRFRSHPVVDADGHLVGAITRWHLHNYERKRFILVDHSSRAQTIDNIDQAEIVEVVDHHHIGDIQTSRPIEYRNRPVGCTCTIIYGIYREQGVTPERGVAGMMLSAIVSDTLLFQSETTTQADRVAAGALAAIAGVDLEAYGTQLLNASVNLKTACIEELIQRDLKRYTVREFSIAVGQTNFADMADIQPRLAEFRQYLSAYQKEQGLDLIVMMFTNVKTAGSLFLFYGPKAAVMQDIIANVFDDGYGSDPSIMSRKQQLIPALTKALEEY